MAAGITDRPREQIDPLLTRLHTRRDRMEAMRTRLRDDSTVQLVTIAERLALAETLRAATTVRDAGMHLDPVLCNRVLPASGSGVLQERQAHEREVLRELHEHFAQEGVREVPLLSGALTGVDDLWDLADIVTR
jgi:arsenite-transporting ATPase